jgi:hypothetical protein
MNLASHSTKLALIASEGMARSRNAPSHPGAFHASDIPAFAQSAQAGDAAS